MNKLKSRIWKRIKKWLKVVDETDFEDACTTIGHAIDRDDFSWRLKMRLFR